MTITTTNRDLLRNFKKLKEKLLSGSLDEVVVVQKGGMVIRIYADKKLSPFQELLKLVEKKPLKGLKRPREDII